MGAAVGVWVGNAVGASVGVAVGCQNVSLFGAGAHTGEAAASAYKDLGCG